MMNYVGIIVIFILFFQGYFPHSLSQMQCVEADDAFHFWMSEVNFVGTVTEINHSETQRYAYVTFDIIYPLKGLDDQSSITVATYSGGSYGYDFQLGLDYMVNVNKSLGVDYFTDLCHGNKLLSTQKDIDEIKSKLLQITSIPPLKLTQYGLAPHAIKCKESLTLLQKYDGSPACVKEKSVPKLIQREWGNSENWIKISNANNAIHYELENAQLKFVLAFSEYTSSFLPEENKQTWLQIGLESTQEGTMKITLPRNLIDAKINNLDDDFFILLDGVETDYQETKTDSERILGFDFPAKVDIVEIVGYGHYNSELSQFNAEPKVEFDVEPIPLEPTINDNGTVSEDKQPYTFYDIHGIKQIYNTGEPISFTETVQGYSNPCVSPHYEILDGNTLEPVWEYKIVYPCPFIKDPQQFKKTNTIPDENISSPILNQTGPYILRSYHSYSDGYTVVTFSVVDDSFVRNTIDPCTVVYDLDANDLRKRTAPPTSISEYGRDATILEPFVFETSIGKITVPSNVPSCYEQKSDKIKNDRRTLVYYPKDMQYDETTTGTKIIREGVLFLVSSTSETTDEWSDSVSKSIKESPDVYSSTTLKGHDVLLVHGIPSKDMASTVRMVIDDKKIQIISTKLDTTYLMEILESMFNE